MGCLNLWGIKIVWKVRLQRIDTI